MEREEITHKRCQRKKILGGIKNMKVSVSADKKLRLRTS